VTNALTQNPSPYCRFKIGDFLSLRPPNHRNNLVVSLILLLVANFPVFTSIALDCIRLLNIFTRTMKRRLLEPKRSRKIRQISYCAPLLLLTLLSVWSSTTTTICEALSPFTSTKSSPGQRILSNSPTIASNHGISSSSSSAIASSPLFASTLRRTQYRSRQRLRQDGGSSSTALHMVLTTPESIIEQASTQNLLDDLIDESVRTSARRPIMMQFDPSSGWVRTKKKKIVHLSYNNVTL
jgi:hypothetical protein